MDTSETYIKMCEKATEIQEGHQWEFGDYFVYVGHVYILVSISEDGFYHGRNSLYETSWEFRGNSLVPCIWLPHQDQLQEMIHDLKYYSKGQFSGSHGLIADFAFWVEAYSNLPCASMEQLWLVFVMKEKYNKIWDSKKEDWVNV
jgi:hypothetical protein